MLTYSIVIATKDRPVLAASAVESLLGQTRRPERIVVVDASTPPLDLPPALHADAAGRGIELRVVHAPPSTSGQRNLGVTMVDTPLVLFVDDDVHLEPGYADALVTRWQEAGLEAFGGMIGSPDVVPPQGRLAGLLRRVLMLHYTDPRATATTFRRSRKLRYAPRPTAEVRVPAVGAGATMFRTDLLRRHPFDERFPGYAPGEDLDMSSRLAADAPIVQVPTVRFTHHWDPRERASPLRWHHRGRREAYFRLRHLGRSPLDLGAFALSVVGELALAAIDAVRDRDAGHVRGYVRGLTGALRDRAADRRSGRTG